MKKKFLKSLLFFYAQILSNDGNLDPSFGTAGLVTSNLPNLNAQTGITIQPDGKIIVGSTLFQGGNEVSGFTRFNSNGSLDQSFGTNGTAIVSFVLANLTLQPDGKIIAAGFVDQSSTFTMALSRLNSDGSVDTTFGQNGIVQTLVPNSSSSNANGLTLQADGKIVVVGQARINGITQALAVRYNSDGSLDNSFGVNGVSVIPLLPGSAAALAIAVSTQEDGKIVIGCINVDTSNTSRFDVVRLDTHGSLDTTFNGGQVVIEFIPANASEQLRCLALQPDGKIVVAGVTTNSTGTSSFAIARLNTDGTVDNSFGIAGKNVTTFTQGTSVADAIAIQADGKILLLGTAGVPGNFNFALARYTINGILDPTFGAGGTPGTLVTPFPGFSSSRGHSLAIQADGKIVAAGDARTLDNVLALARYLDQPPLTATTITNPTNGSIITGNFTISGTAQNPANVTIFANDQIVATGVTSGAENSWALIILGLPAGTYQIVVNVHYKSGNVDMRSNTITITVTNALTSPLVAAIRSKYCF